MKKNFLFMVLLLVIAAVALSWYLLTTKGDAKRAPRATVKLQLQWFHQAQFIGFYVAEANHYYAQEGIDVEFDQGGPEVNPIQKVVSKQANIGIVTGDQVLSWQNNNGNDFIALKAIGTVFNRNIAMFMSKQSKKITNISDLKGKTVGVYPNYDTENILLCLLKKHNISSDEVPQKQFPNLLEFLSEKGSVDVFPAYVINEPLVAEQQGVKIDLLDPEKHGVRFYSDTIFVTSAYLSDNRETVKKFLRASAKGWSFARTNPEESLKLMYEVVGSSLGRGEQERHQQQMLNKTIEFLRPGDDNLIFKMDESRWQEMAKALFEIGKIRKETLHTDICEFKLVEEASKK